MKTKLAKIKSGIRRAVRPCLIVIFFCVIGYGLFRLWDTHRYFVMEERIRAQMEQFKPAEITARAAQDGEDVIVNQNIVDAQELNPDIVGWLTMEGTGIDYPFVQTLDNEYYLRRDINGEYAFAGTVFMDYRHDKTFSGFSGVIYGHNMENGTMFSDIRRYDNADFFAANQHGYLYLTHATYRLEVFAYMAVQSTDSVIYAAGTMDAFDREQFLTYVAENAHRYRDLSLTAADRLVVLSTCTNTSNEARSVILARLVRIA